MRRLKWLQLRKEGLCIEFLFAGCFWGLKGGEKLFVVVNKYVNGGNGGENSTVWKSDVKCNYIGYFRSYIFEAGH